MRVLKKVMKTVCLVLMGIVLLLNLLTMALSGLGLRDQLNWLPGALLTVESGSMEPVLSEGDLLFVWETPYDALEVGDIVTFHGNNELVTHQIVRQEGSRFVTRGAANNVEDESIGPEEYCAKVVQVIPQAGVALRVLTDPARLLLLALFVLAVFYGMPLLRLVCGMLEGKKNGHARPHLLRLMAAGMVISTFCVTPFVTAAKYTADINEYASVSAGATYFTSNYLSEEGNIYQIQGWNGLGGGISVDIRNYENDLLFNKTGHDLHYQLELKRLDADGSTSYSTDYTLELQADGETLESTNGKYGSFLIAGNDDDGQHTRYEVAFAALNEQPLHGGTKIRFQVIASTTDSTDFDQKLLGDFTFEAANAESFLGEHGPQSQVGAALVTYSLKTELVEGATTRNVKVTWDNTKVYLNEFEATAANIIANDTEKTRYSADDGNGRGFLIMSLHAYSKVNLQFFKYDSSTVVGADDFTCTEVELETGTEGTS